MKAIGSAKQEIEEGLLSSLDRPESTDNDGSSNFHVGGLGLQPCDVYYICGAAEFDRRVNKDQSRDAGGFGSRAIQPEYGFDTDSPHLALDSTWAKDTKTVVRSLTGGDPELVAGILHGNQKTQSFIQERLEQTNNRLFLSEHGLADPGVKPSLAESSLEARKWQANLQATLEQENEIIKKQEQAILDVEMGM